MQTDFSPECLDSVSEDVTFGKGHISATKHGMHATSMHNGTPSKSKKQQQQQQQQQQAAKPKFQFQTLVFKVELHCDACLRKVKKAISQVEGVETINCDAKVKKVTVTGHFDPQKVLKKVAKTGKRIELVAAKDLNNAGNNNANSSNNNNNNNAKPSNTTKASENFHDYSQLETLTTAFSDENVNSCSVM